MFILIEKNTCEVVIIYPQGTVVGRERAGANILKDKSYISRQHASFVDEGNRVQMISFGRNGTVVNGNPVRALDYVYLNSGDIITLGGEECNKTATFVLRKINP